jgi:hypothetical protein
MNCRTRKWADARIASARQLVSHLVDKWHRLPLLCNHCCHPIDASSVSESEQMGWCPNCRRPFRAPMFRVPGWVAGTILLLLMKAQVGI